MIRKYIVYMVSYFYSSLSADQSSGEREKKQRREPAFAGSLSRCPSGLRLSQVCDRTGTGQS